MLKVFALMLVASLAGLSQGPERSGRGGPGGRDWWDNPLSSNLNLTEAQRKQIKATTQEFRNRLVDTRATAEKAESDLQAAFNDVTADDRRVNELVDRVVKARGEVMKQVTLMSWKLRSVLTAEQWQELQRRRPGSGLPDGGQGRRGGRGGKPGDRPGSTGAQNPKQTGQL